MSPACARYMGLVGVKSHRKPPAGIQKRGLVTRKSVDAVIVGSVGCSNVRRAPVAKKICDETSEGRKCEETDLLGLTPDERDLLAAANKVKGERARRFLECYLNGYVDEPDTALADLIADFR